MVGVRAPVQSPSTRNQNEAIRKISIQQKDTHHAQFGGFVQRGCAISAPSNFGIRWFKTQPKSPFVAYPSSFVSISLFFSLSYYCT